MKSHKSKIGEINKSIFSATIQVTKKVFHQSTQKDSKEISSQPLYETNMIKNSHKTTNTESGIKIIRYKTLKLFFHFAVCNQIIAI
jgi:hypothetical protein